MVPLVNSAGKHYVHYGYIYQQGWHIANPKECILLALGRTTLKCVLLSCFLEEVVIENH